MIVAVWGAEKTGKTTMALTFPKPLYHFDLDVGGFDRASHRFTGQDIKSKPYPSPLQLEKLMGRTDLTVRASRRLVGMRELWQSFLVDYAELLNDGALATVVIDSATQLWTVCHQSFLQEKQEAQQQGAKLRESLLPIEYAEPNSRMKSIIYAARSFSKNLVLTHYPRDVYAQRLTEKGIEEYKTGEVEIDGFKATSALVDIAVNTSVRAATNDSVASPVAVVTLSGLDLRMTGMSIEPTYESIINTLKTMRGES